jgi:hypothetical protein
MHKVTSDNNVRSLALRSCCPLLLYSGKSQAILLLVAACRAKSACSQISHPCIISTPLSSFFSCHLLLVLVLCTLPLAKSSFLDWTLLFIGLSFNLQFSCIFTNVFSFDTYDRLYGVDHALPFRYMLDK